MTIHERGAQEVRCGQCGQILDDGAKDFMADGNAAVRRFIDEAPAQSSEPFAQWAATTGKALEQEITLWMQKSEAQNKRIDELDRLAQTRRQDLDYLLEQQRDQLQRANTLIENTQKLQRDFNEAIRQRDEAIRQRDDALRLVTIWKERFLDRTQMWNDAREQLDARDMLFEDVLSHEALLPAELVERIKVETALKPTQLDARDKRIEKLSALLREAVEHLDRDFSWEASDAFEERVYDALGEEPACLKERRATRQNGDGNDSSSATDRPEVSA